MSTPSRAKRVSTARTVASDTCDTSTAGERHTNRRAVGRSVPRKAEASVITAGKASILRTTSAISNSPTPGANAASERETLTQKPRARIEPRPGHIDGYANAVKGSKANQGSLGMMLFF